jgi:hypothetical protein
MVGRIRLVIGYNGFLYIMVCRTKWLAEYNVWLDTVGSRIQWMAGCNRWHDTMGCDIQYTMVRKIQWLGDTKVARGTMAGGIHYIVDKLR